MGLLASGLLTLRHARFRVGDLFCPDSPALRGGCDAVLASKYSALGGVPLAHLGVGFHSLALAVALLALASGRPGARKLLLALGVVGLLASGAFVMLQLAVIRAVCPLCMMSAVGAVMLLVGAWATRRDAGGGHALPVAIGAAVAVPAMSVAVLVFVVRSTVSGDRELLARFDGRPITLADMRRDTPDVIESLDMEAYEVRLDYINRKLGGLAIDAEARKHGLTPREFLKREVDDPLERDDRPRFEALAAELSTDEEGRQRFVRNLLAEAREGRIDALVASLLGRHRTEILVRPPLGRKVELDASLATDAHHDGPPDAPLQLVVFSDFQCPICARLDEILREVGNRLGGRLSVTYRHFPLKDHAHAVPAAILAECVARETGAEGFARFKKSVFARRGQITPETLREDALSAGLTALQIERCLQDPDLRSRVERSAAEARALRLDGAPTLILNNRVLGGFMEPDTLERRLREALK